MSATLNSYQKVTWLSTNKNRTCPICKSAGFCEISDDGRLAHCMRVPNGKEINYRFGGWIHQLGISYQGATIADLRPKAKPETLAPLSPEVLDRVNRRLLELLPLSKEHETYLQEAGVNPAYCGTFLLAKAASVAKELVKEFGESVAHRSPVLVYNDRGQRPYWTITGYAKSGILFPAINEQTGLIAGVQLRNDAPAGPKDRYKWLGRDGLAGTPLTILTAPAASQRLVITEGFKKASNIRTHYGCHAVSVPGVDAYKLPDLLTAIDNAFVTEIAIAFDMDKLENVRVRNAVQKLIRLIKATRPGLKIYLLEWEATHKGIDDAIKAKAVITETPGKVEPGRQYSWIDYDLPLEVYSAHFGQPRPLFTLEQARTKHRELADRLLEYPEPGSQYAVTSVTGTGKSTAFDDAIATAAYSGLLDRNRRPLILAPNKENIAERTRPNTLLGQAVMDGLVAIQQGRNLIDLNNPESKRTAFDCANPQAKDAGAARHAAQRVICSKCPFGSADNWQKHAREYGYSPDQPRPFECEKDGYIHSRKVSEKALAVIATKDAYLNNSDKQLEAFSHTIVDEDLFDYLKEEITLTTQTLSTWREKISRLGLDAGEWLKLFEVCETTLNSLSETVKPKKGERQSLYPVRDVLKNTAAQLGYYLEKVADSCADQGMTAEDTYHFEKPYRFNNKTVIPYRAAIELRRALLGELSIRAARAADGSFSLVIRSMRSHLVDLLKEQTVILLDATLQEQIKQLFPNIKEICFDVPQNLEITQTTNALYSKSDLHNDKTRVAVEAVIAKHFEGSVKPLAFIPQRFEDGEKQIKLPEGAAVTHWGLHRATNQYSDCDALVMVGHHQRPIDHIEADVECLRLYLDKNYRPEVRVKEPNQKLRLYNYQDQDRRAVGRWGKAHVDELLQKVIEDDYTAAIFQCIGRLRGALRPVSEAPARVLILCNEPVADLKINKLTSAKELLQEAVKAQPAPVIELASHAATPPTENTDFSINIFMKYGNSRGGVDFCEGVLPEKEVEPLLETADSSKISTALVEVNHPELIASGTFTPLPTAPAQEQHSSFYYGYRAMLERQAWPEGIEDVERRIRDNGMLDKLERKLLLVYADTCREKLLVFA